MKRLNPFALLVVLMMSGCPSTTPALLPDGGLSPLSDGGMTAGTGGGTGTTPTARAYCESSLKELCAKQVECGLFQERASCERGFDSSPACTFADNPRQLFSPSAAEVEACLASIRSNTSCSFDDFPACSVLLKPNVARGGDCYFSSECQAADSCAIGPSRCPGKCVERVALGEKISEARPECLKGAYAATDGTCTVQVATGGACAVPASQAQVCREPRDSCENNLCTAAKAKVGLGAACAASGDTCQSNLQCIAGKCAKYAALGEACGDGQTLGLCKFDLYCKAGTCAAQLTAGQQCVSDERSCRTDLVCVPGPLVNDQPGPSTCTALKALGANCTADLECKRGGFCKAKVCTAQLDVGATCDPMKFAECKAGLNCSRTSKTCERTFCTAP